MNIEHYSKLINSIESKLDEADELASLTNIRYSHDEIFSKLKKKIDEAK